jgi:hypothetical protein
MITAELLKASEIGRVGATILAVTQKPRRYLAVLPQNIYVACSIA